MKTDLKPPLPVLPEAVLKSYVERYFRKRSVYLDIADKNNGPFYLLERKILEERVDQFKNAFKAVLPDTGFYFAMKSNNAPEVSEVVISSGFGIDVSSGVELQAAIDAGSTDIIFSGPGKTDDELRLAVNYASYVTILIDSFGELQRLEKTAASLDTNVRAGVRLTNGASGLWRKFGILSSDIPFFYKSVLACPHIHLEGIQFHSSWNMNPDRQAGFIVELGSVLKTMPVQFKKNIKFIDIGGGYWPQQGEWLHSDGTGETDKIEERAYSPHLMKHYLNPAVPIESFAEEIGSSIQEHIFPVVRCRILFEPGRWICNDAMHLLFNVIDKKTQDLVITDAGTNAIGWERYETDYFPVLNLTRPSFEEKACMIMGSLCTPHDLWGYSYWGRDIQPGDVLMIPTQGAYTYSLRQSFIKPVPKLLMI